MPLGEDRFLKAIKELKDKLQDRNFTQSIELIINLRDIDAKDPENRIQELIELPYAAEEMENRVCVFASGEMALKAKRGGADRVIDRTELEAMTGDKKSQKDLVKSYDFFIAEAPLMPLVGKILGSILGPKGKMPTPVSPTADVAGHIKSHRKMVLVRLRGQPVLQCRVGTESMPEKKIAENIQA
ncbi:50S ribosomal protein L1, partial [Candidatus Bathyarchaeota archaeon]|nr:50S ribosomal protein L1 [Candidatus Bathyarchaeota archaeon]NIR16301.1 50S ribosomal protein L1 [Desulfobacterales bacterium]NIU80709.1 50S ribosomal protein L1 [Candidatus Bathyarchaeota archaeon]NIV68081.1 50S ribosomal protein L1 [Candidatus Bathyarchaeota archaeon]NIW15888.1 50S ribosomal protein L1 [Candidatus Bathyarchaeota archaeon]